MLIEITTICSFVHADYVTGIHDERTTELLTLQELPYIKTGRLQKSLPVSISVLMQNKRLQFIILHIHEILGIFLTK